MHQGPFKKSAIVRGECIEQSANLFKKVFEDGSKRVVFSRKNDEKKYVVRHLMQNEIDTLMGNKCACRCSNWNMIRLMFCEQKSNETSDLSSSLLDQYSNCFFSGSVILGVVIGDLRSYMSKGQDTTKQNEPSHIRLLHPGIHQNTCIHDCILEPGCRIYGNGILERTHVYPNASVINCGTITTFNDQNDDFKFGHKLDICVGPETGGQRSILIFPESTLEDACQHLSISCQPIQKDEKYLINKKTHSLFSKKSMNLLLPYSSIHNNPNTISNVYISSHATIHSSSTVSGATLLPHSSISSNSSVTNTCLQWNALISNSAVVSNSLIMESSSACTSAIVNSSILGPDVHVEGGETHHSLIGANVNSHHQSLLIGVIWPYGRGNVGYGSNIGSNHTGRIPDQECWAGEGIFWGLSCVIKFPINLMFSPYSIIAAGCSLQPQKIEMPFSLILPDTTIHPGWVLGHSPYTIVRSERKFIQRRKAHRHKYYTGWQIMRRGIVEMCWNARCMLMFENVGGIGKCKLNESSRKAGIDFYTDYIQRYALRGFLEQLLNVSDSRGSFDALLQSISQSTNLLSYGENVHNSIISPWEEPSFYNHDSEWVYQRSIIAHEFSNSTVSDLLKTLVSLELNHADSVAYSKSKDDFRGFKVIPKYENTHILSENDEVVKLTRYEVSKIQNKVKRLIDENCIRPKSIRCRL